MRIPDETRDQLAVKLAVLFPQLDERQRRLLMAAEARGLGHGGVRAVARAAGVSGTTVRKGMSDLEAGDSLVGRVRRPRGGRKRIVDLLGRPATIPAAIFLPQVAHAIRGIFTYASVTRPGCRVQQTGHPGRDAYWSRMPGAVATRGPSARSSSRWASLPSAGAELSGPASLSVSGPCASQELARRALTLL